MPHAAVTPPRSALAIAEQLTVPDGLRFADLELRYAPDGSVSFATEPLNKICIASGIDPMCFDCVEGGMIVLIAAWYGQAIARGESSDAVMEDMVAEWALAPAQGSQPRYVGTA